MLLTPNDRQKLWQLTKAFVAVATSKFLEMRNCNFAAGRFLPSPKFLAYLEQTTTTGKVRVHDPQGCHRVC